MCLYTPPIGDAQSQASIIHTFIQYLGKTWMASPFAPAEFNSRGDWVNKVKRGGKGGE